MLKRAITATMVISALMLGILLNTTTPATAGPVGILAFFVFLYLSALGVLAFLFRGISVVLPKIPFFWTKKHPNEGLPLRRSYYYASIVAAAPVMLVAMHSVGDVGPYQVLLVVLFVSIGWVYIANRTA